MPWLLPTWMVTSIIDVIGASINDDEIGFFENTDGQMGMQTTAEETPLTFNAANNNLVWISDSDAGALEMKVRLEITGGTISLNGTTNLNVDIGTGTDDAVVEFRGSATDINVALDGMVFTPTDDFNGVASIRILTDDQGNSGSGGVLTDDDTINITVTPVNDAPTIATNTGVTVLEGSTGNTITTAMLNEGDVDDAGAGLVYTITNVTDNGTMYLSGFGTLGLNDTFTQAEIDAGDVTYDHNGSETSSDTFSFSLADGLEDGATAATGTFNFTVTAVNDNDPTIMSDGGGASAAVNVLENDLFVTTVAATDADLPAETLTYSISGGVDAAKFAIDGSTGVLTFVASPDFESPTDSGGNNVYDVIVQVSDGTRTDTQSIAVTID